MEIEAIARERLNIVERYGEWTDHNIHLGDGIYTIDGNSASEKLSRVLQVAADMARKPFSELRILDLACLEGQYAIEFARHGAECVAIEGREANLEKARFARKVLGLEKLTLCLDDVRNLSREKYGEFDIALCLGILYHLDGPDVFPFVERIGEVCRGFAVFDTYVSVATKRKHVYKGREYWGRDVFEHDPTAQAVDKLKDRWASLDNASSFWITRNSLLNLLIQSGFTSTYECQVPAEPAKRADRITLVAVKGRRQQVMNIPKLNDRDFPLVPEVVPYEVAPQQRPLADFTGRLNRMVPRSLKRAIRSLLPKRTAPGSQPWEWAEPWQRRSPGKNG